MYDVCKVFFCKASQGIYVMLHLGYTLGRDKVYRNYSMLVFHGATHIDLVEFDMLDFYIILGMDWFLILLCFH